ncbi:hypothetical protein BCON_0104g00190 [Botryotinia convoluta]|uniref:Carboxylic ester hydrolase n=1 Tax=Botryotinia convoluta TaxID=54673 RepID=A0A4Z1I562_9HELO|nr:hypothetical protein BCON_0104g00190 [Botryotinia convoluta]
MKYITPLNSLLLASIIPQVWSWEVGNGVQTSSGFVHGHAASNTFVSEYLGIPYAQPPIGELRFAAPQKYIEKTSINGADFGYSCPIASTYSSLVSPEVHSDLNFTAADCLTLNIWTKPQTGEKRKAVLVWFPGGGFVAGSPHSSGYNGQQFADKEDFVIVSVSYRLNIFGFPGNPMGDNNLGLLDQRAAVQWVHDNIKYFGGDPARITIFGESAGGASVDLYSYAFVSNPLVAGFIAQSGTTQLQPPINASSSADLNFIPTIDDTIVFSDYTSRSLAGNFIKYPMLIGHNDAEGNIFSLIAQMKGITLPETYWSSYETSTFFCPAAIRANVSVHNHLPIWRYRYFGDFPDMQLRENIDSGAYHGAEIYPLFGNTPSGVGIPKRTVREVDLGRYMMKAWATFAKDPHRGLRKLDWPIFSPGEDTLIRLGFRNITALDLSGSAEYDAGCPSAFPV